MFKFLRFKFCSFKQFDLNQNLIKYLNCQQIFRPTTIQKLCFSQLNDDKYDQFYIAGQTGVGKTLAYLLPSIHNLKPNNKIQMIVIVPTVELVIQLNNIISKMSKFIDIQFYNSNNVNDYKKSGINVLISNINQFNRIENNQKLIENSQYLIIDEIDTFLDTGFKNRVQELIQLNQQKTIFVSATFTAPLKKLFNDYRVKKLIDFRTHQNLTNIQHEFIFIENNDKFDIMKQEIQKLLRNQKNFIMIFTNSMLGCNNVYKQLIELNINCLQLHGDLSENTRKENLDLFSKKKSQILISTDLGSRGLDFKFLTHVINFDFPATRQDYLHRVGRTGRCGKKGNVLSFYKQKDIKNVELINKAFENQQSVKLKGAQNTIPKKKEVLTEQQQQIKDIKKTKIINKKNNSPIPQDYLEFKENHIKSTELQEQKQYEKPKFLGQAQKQLQYRKHKINRQYNKYK